MSRTLALAVLVACAHSFVAAQAITPDGALKLNQIQVIGTHNSYRAGIASSEAKLMESHEPQSFEELDYLPSVGPQYEAGAYQLNLHALVRLLHGGIAR